MSSSSKGKTDMNRRQFLVASAAATVAFSLRPNAVLAGEIKISFRNFMAGHDDVA